jgi:hypothetical protein
MDFLIGTGLGLLFLLLSWSYGRGLSGGGPLNLVKRRILAYGFIFILGMMYLMLLVSDLHWREELLFPMIGVWGLIVGLVAWWFHRRWSRSGRRLSESDLTRP